MGWPCADPSPYCNRAYLGVLFPCARLPSTVRIMAFTPTGARYVSAAILLPPRVGAGGYFLTRVLVGVLLITRGEPAPAVRGQSFCNCGALYRWHFGAVDRRLGARNKEAAQVVDQSSICWGPTAFSACSGRRFWQQSDPSSLVVLGLGVCSVLV